MNQFDELKNIFDMLSDDVSKDIFIKRLSYSLTNDYSNIVDIVKTYCSDLRPMAEWGKGGFQSLLDHIQTDKEIVIWGCGKYGRMWIDYVKNDNRVVAYCDSDKKKQGIEFGGYVVIEPSDLQLDKYKDAVVIVASIDFEQEIYNEVCKLKNNKRDIYLTSSVINVASVHQYFDEPFLLFTDNEVFVDAGSYDLWTTITFWRKNPGLSKVFAFEPNISNYNNCCAIKQSMGMDFVELIQKGTWDCNTTLKFTEKRDSSRIEDVGGVTIDTITIDEVVKDANVTYIKMDVEGAEYRTLIGAKKTIERCHPRLAVSIYHKPEDIVVLSKLIKSLCGVEYNFYLRHYSNATNETVFYAIPMNV